MKKRIENLFAVTAPGLEELCACELRALGVDDVHVVKGGVEFKADLRGLYSANLWLRTASRILVRVGEFKSRDFPDLFRRAVRLPWGKYIRQGTPVMVRAASQSSRLNHTGRISETVSAAIDRALGREKGVAEGSEQLVLVRFENDRCLFSVDSSGELLHRRGYRKETAHAPLRETLAAAVLMLMGWDGSEPLVDPMCGSGTFLIEGALLASKSPPGMNRSFSFMEWPRFRKGLWDNLLQEAQKGQVEVTIPIWGFDQDEEAIRSAGKNLDRANLGSFVRLSRQDIEELCYPPGHGLVLCNPPYGERLGAGQDLKPLFSKLGQVYSAAGPGWRGGILCPDSDLITATGLPLNSLARLVNGGIPVTLFKTET